MNTDWRTLLYPLGFLASLAFGGRFIVQWIQSERKKESHVTPVFWQLSLCGNLLLALHSFIQIQYPFCLIQALNAVLAWRNLNIMREGSQQASLQKIFIMLFLTALLTTALFVIQGYLFFDHLKWVRTPLAPWSSGIAEKLPLMWHLLGFVGAALFAGRFWIQWWQAESRKVSYLSSSFWWFSLVGALLTLTYAVRMSDFVNILGYSIGIVPYLRNLMIIKKTKAALKETGANAP